jgi:adenylate cyclase
VAVADSGGFATVSPDADGVLRRYRTVASAGGLVLPSLGVAVLSRALGEGGRPAPVVPVGAAGAPASLVQVRVGPLALEVDDLGRVPLGWLGPFAAFPSVSAADVLHGRLPEGALRGRVALVGATAAGTWDQRVTPFDRIAPGVAAHATFVENALTGGLLDRSGAVLAGEGLALAALAVLLAGVFSRVSALAAVPALLAAAGAWIAVAVLALRRHGTVLAVGMPLVEIGLAFVAATSYRFFAEEREKRRARETFGRFLAPAIVEQVLSRDGALRLGGEKRELTVLFADVRGFTGISERLDPHVLLELLNEYLAPMTEVIVERHEGTLDKYIGDAIMAFWGAPTPQPDHALRACRAALDMAARLDALREGWRARGLPDLDVGIGVNTGPMSVGFVGSQDRFYNYTVLGDAVNLAARLEGANRSYGTRILVGPSTRAQAGAALVTRELDRVRVKGKREPVAVHELVAAAPAPPATAAFLEAFAQGLSAYQGQRWDEAAARFREADRLRGGDPPSRVYLERCEAMGRAPPGPGWDGVFEMHVK